MLQLFFQRIFFPYLINISFSLPIIVLIKNRFIFQLFHLPHQAHRKAVATMRTGGSQGMIDKLQKDIKIRAKSIQKWVDFARKTLNSYEEFSVFIRKGEKCDEILKSRLKKCIFAAKSH